MKISTFIYEKSLAAPREVLFWDKWRKLLVKYLGDPSCFMDIHGKRLELPLSHALPRYLRKFPFYDRLPARLSDFVYRTDGVLKCIDVGANVGDSIAAFNQHDSDEFLAIEPNPSFNKYLQANYGSDNSVEIIDCVCSSSNLSGTYNIKERCGTASFDKSDSGKVLDVKTLDDIVEENGKFSDFNLLKIDTDGHDFEVIAGAKKIISERMPVILFECDSFTNKYYVQNCMDAFDLFRKAGYLSFLVYDNYGYLVGRYLLSDTNAFRQLLFYQLTSKFHYFDILLMKEGAIASFFESEVELFLDNITDKSLKKTAKYAVSM